MVKFCISELSHYTGSGGTTTWYGCYGQMANFLYLFDTLLWHFRIIISFIISFSSGHEPVTTGCQMFIIHFTQPKFINFLKQRWTYCDFWSFQINIGRSPWSPALLPEHEPSTQCSLTQQHHQKHYQEYIHCPATNIETLLTTINILPHNYKHQTRQKNTRYVT